MEDSTNLEVVENKTNENIVSPVVETKTTIFSDDDMPMLKEVVPTVNSLAENIDKTSIDSIVEANPGINAVSSIEVPVDDMAPTILVTNALENTIVDGNIVDSPGIVSKTPPKRNKSALLIVLLILIVGIVATCMYFLKDNAADNTSSSSSDKQSSSEEQSSEPESSLEDIESIPEEGRVMYLFVKANDEIMRLTKSSALDVAKTDWRAKIDYTKTKVIDEVEYVKTFLKYQEIVDKYSEIFTGEALENIMAAFIDIDGYLYAKATGEQSGWSIRYVKLTFVKIENGQFFYTASYNLAIIDPDTSEERITNELEYSNFVIEKTLEEYKISKIDLFEKH